MSSRTEKLHLEREAWNEAAQVAPGFWVIATHHRPGTSRFAPRINNRCLIFRLNDASDGGRPVLLAVNAIDPAVLPLVHQVERETGLTVRYLVSPGGGHSLWLAEWHDALPEARVLVGPARIPRLSSVKGLLGSSRFGTLDSDNPLPQFQGQVDFVNFDGLLAFPEILTPKEGGKDSRFLLIRTLLFQRANDPTDELWLCHRATHTCVGGENLGWIFTPEHSASLGFSTRMLLKPDVVKIIAIGITQFAFVGMLQAENTGNLGPPSSLELDPTVGHISLYGKRDWEGSTFKLDQPGAIANLRSVNFNNRTTSIGGRGFGSIWELCEKPAYAGWCLWIGSGKATRRLGALNDKVSSLRWLSNEALREIRVILYRDRNSNRPSIRQAESALNAFRSGSRRLAGQGSAQINNEASAVEIRSGSWEFCKDRDFAGGCIVLGPGLHDLHAL